MAAVAKATGRPRPPVPILPREGATVWQIFLELNATRSSGMAVNPISYTEIDSWQRVTGVPLDAWEVMALRALDAEFISVISKE
jgi:hypothetical protein